MKEANATGAVMPSAEEVASLFGVGSADEIREHLMGYVRLMAYYRCAMMEIETKLNVLNEEFSLRFDRQPITDIRARLKRPESIRGKLVRYGWPMTLASIEENLSDVAGVRVICSFTADVYQLAEALLSQDDITLVARKDYIASPKPNGYRSLHLVVTVPIFLERGKRLMRVEIQLRTIAMDAWAALEHQLRYKKDTALTDANHEELMRCAGLAAELDGRMDALRRAAHLDD